LLLSVIGILTLLIGVGVLFSMAALVTGVLALRRVPGRARSRGVAILGLLLALVSLVVAGSLVFFGAVEQNHDECWPVKQHAGCY
jgi:hypothetical protein